TIAVVVVTLSDQASSFTALCAWVYLGARVLYVPAYALGWRPGRSIIWAVGFTATVLMVISTLI
ncbi:MAG: MAPEG family protein, partial [Jannaschia helgolandensis]